MKKHLLLILFCLATTGATAQHIGFEQRDYRAIGVYDRWEQSPFRDGRLAGNAAVTANPDASGNASDSVVAFRRSRLASNIFGVRIDLLQPFALSPQGKTVHVLIHRPQGGRVMLVGLGKRTDRPGQRADVEQFWVYSSTPVPHGQWADAVFRVKSASGVEIHSLVVVPDAESPHRLTADWVAYVDDIAVDDQSAPRIAAHTAADTASLSTATGQPAAYVTAASRNGTVVATDGQTLNRYAAPTGAPFGVKIVAAPGFGCKGLRVRYGQRLAGPQMADGRQMWQETYIDRQRFEGDTCTLPAACMAGEVEIEGDFVSQQ